MKKFSCFLIGLSLVGQLLSILLMIYVIAVEEPLRAIEDNIVFIGIIMFFSALQYFGWRLFKIQRSDREKRD